MERDDLPKTDDEWKQRLTPMQVEVLSLAALRVRQLAGAREAVLFHRETVERLEQELSRLRG